VPKTQETKAEKAARLRDEARLAVEVAREAEEAAEEEAAAEREAEREQTKEELDRAKQALERAREEVEGLERKLKQQNDVERRKRKRSESSESGESERSEEDRSEEGESRRVAARKEEKIVMVDDRQFQEAMGAHGGAVRRAWVERSVYCSRAEAGEAEELFAASTGTDGEVVVKGFTAVKQYDAWMERKKLVKRTIDIDMRCKNTEGPMEPDWYQDTERVWVKRGSAELAALDKLIANERARKWQWQCPDSPRSPVYRPARPESTAYYAYAPSPVDDDHDDESNFVD
jgi:hypothetical protein